MNAFVAMPFNPKFLPIWRVIKQACETNKVTAIRADHLGQLGNVLDQIHQAIDNSTFVIVDFTGDQKLTIPNPNVVAEAKYADIKKKTLIILTQDPNVLPFDWRQYRAIIYQKSPNGLQYLSANLAEIIEKLIKHPPTIKISCYRGNLQRTGVYPSNAIRTLNGCKWRVQIESNDYSLSHYYPPTITSDSIYITVGTSHFCFLHSLQPDSGSLKWKFDSSQTSLPAIYKEAIYLIGNNYSDDKHKYLYAINAQTGYPIWNQILNPLSVESQTDNNLSIINGILYFGHRSIYYAIETETKNVIWQLSNDSFGNPTIPALSDEIIYLGGNSVGGDKNLVALELKTGNILWLFPVNCCLQANPVISETTIYFGCNNWFLYALDIKTGGMKWRFKAKAQITHPPAVFNETVYFSSGDTLYALDTQTQTKKWEISYPNTELLEPIITEDIIYLGSHTNKGKAHLYAVDINTGKEVWKFKTQGSSAYSPVIFDGVLYFVSNDGFMYALH